MIGKTGRDISRDDARALIFGFMIFNDFSARDTQGMEMESGLGPSKPKDFDGVNAIREVIHRYCHGAGRCDLEAFKACYWEDGYDDHGF